MISPWSKRAPAGLSLSGRFFPVSGRSQGARADEVLPARLAELVARYSPPAMHGVPILLWRDLPAQSTTVYKHVDFYAIFLIERGRGVHVIDSTPYAVSRGDVYVVGKGANGRFLDCE